MIEGDDSGNLIEHTIKFSKTKEIKSLYISFKDYVEDIWSLCSFYDADHYPFTWWSHISKKVIDLLKTLIKENKLNQFKTDKRYINLIAKIQLNIEECNHKKLTQLVKKYKKTYHFKYALGQIYDKGSKKIQNIQKALFWYEEVAKQGYIEAQMRLGEMYFRGLGISKDYKKALYWYKKVTSSQNNLDLTFYNSYLVDRTVEHIGVMKTKAQMRLGEMYFQGLGISKDYKKAFYWYEKAAQKHDFSSFFHIGMMYFKGWGVSQNYLKSYIHFDLASKCSEDADKNAEKMKKELITFLDKNALNKAQEQSKKIRMKLFIQVLHTEMKPINPFEEDETLNFYKKHGKDLFKTKDFLLEFLNLKWEGEKTWRQLISLEDIISSELCRRKDKKYYGMDPIYIYFQKYQRNGFSFGDRFGYTPFNKEGDILREGWNLLKVLIQENKLKNYKKDPRFQKLNSKLYDRLLEIEFKNTKKLAENGSDTSQYELARMYHEGIKIPQNYTKALYWYEKSAEQGNMYAQNNTATMYILGLHGKKNYKKAFYWYSKSAERGDVLAQVSLGKMYLEGLGCSQNYKNALYWYEKAVENKNGDAEYELGRMYEQGLGVLKDDKKSFELYERAAHKNCVPAQQKLSDLYFEGIKQSQDYKKAYIWMDLVCKNLFRRRCGCFQKKRKNINAFIIFRIKIS